MARGVVGALGSLDGDVDVAGVLESLEVLGAPLVLAGLVDAPFAPATPLDVSVDAPLLGALLLGAMLLGVMPLGALLLGGVPLGAVLIGAVLLGAALVEESAGVVLEAGRVRFTSPLDVPVTVLLGDALVTGTQSVVPVAEPAAPAPVGEVAVVPLAPFVMFGPLKRCSGFVAVLRAESAVAPVTPAVEPVAEAELGLIVVVVE